MAGHFSMDNAWMNEGDNNSLFDYFERKLSLGNINSSFCHTVNSTAHNKTPRN